MRELEEVEAEESAARLLLRRQERSILGDAFEESTQAWEGTQGSQPMTLPLPVSILLSKTLCERGIHEHRKCGASFAETG